MVIGDGANRVEIALLEVRPDGTPDAGDLRFAVGVRCGEFLGRNDRVWVDAGVWERFLGELRAVERTRQGEARLASMSPADLELRLAAIGRAGRLAVEGHVGEYVYVEQQAREIRLSFAIALDPGRLPTVLRELESLAAGG